MPIKSQDLSIYQGDDYAAMINVYQSDNVTPANLTGFTAQAQIRPGPADQAPVAAEFTTAIVLPNQISISLTHTQTTSLTAFGYEWDLQITSSAGAITTLLAGAVAVTQEVTREPAVLMAR
jgi:hypothetical protein